MHVINRVSVASTDRSFCSKHKTGWPLDPEHPHDWHFQVADINSMTMEQLRTRVGNKPMYLFCHQVRSFNSHVLHNSLSNCAKSSKMQGRVFADSLHYAPLLCFLFQRRNFVMASFLEYKSQRCCDHWSGWGNSLLLFCTLSPWPRCSNSSKA